MPTLPEYLWMNFFKWRSRWLLMLWVSQAPNYQRFGILGRVGHRPKASISDNSDKPKASAFGKLGMSVYQSLQSCYTGGNSMAQMWRKKVGAKKKSYAKVVLSLLEEFVKLFAPLYVSVYFSSLQIVSLKSGKAILAQDSWMLSPIPRLSHNFGLVFGQKFLPNALIAYLTTWECDSTIFLQIRLLYLWRSNF